MPDLRNLGAREALRQLTRLGLQVRMTGHGVVASQDVAPGAAVEPGRVCTLVLARRGTDAPEPGTAQ
jgi:multidrug resistance efflux pump